MVKKKSKIGKCVGEKPLYYGYEPANEPEDKAEENVIPQHKPETVDGRPPKQTEAKLNKKLEALVSQLSDKKGRLNKYLKQQGLGQNARRKVIELVNDINVVKNLIAFEEKWSK